MRVQVLGCSATELPDANLSSFLIDQKILLDAGTIGEMLHEKEQRKIKHILITHAHLDHIKDLPFFADNMSMNDRNHSVTVMSIPSVNRALRQNLLNNVLWPDFTKIPSPKKPIIRLKDIIAEKSFKINGYIITAHAVNHNVPAVGYLIEDKNSKRLFYTGDTGTSDSLWKFIDKKLHGLIIEVSFPERFKSVALKSGHLTPKLLYSELKKMDSLPEMIYITHCKPRYCRRIRDELEALPVKNIRMLKDGEVLEI
jgi:ribonuclease BN (tRNA processing enzyme)